MSPGRSPRVTLSGAALPGGCAEAGQAKAAGPRWGGKSGQAWSHVGCGLKPFRSRPPALACLLGDPLASGMQTLGGQPDRSSRSGLLASPCHLFAPGPGTEQQTAYKASPCPLSFPFWNFPTTGGAASFLLAIPALLLPCSNRPITPARQPCPVASVPTNPDAGGFPGTLRPKQGPARKRGAGS